MQKHILKAKLLTIIIASIFLTSSCDTKEDQVTGNTQTNHRLSDEDIATASKIIKTKDNQVKVKKSSLTNKTFIEAAPEEPYLEYKDLISTQDLRIEIDSRTSHILDQTYEQNIQYLNDLHLFSTNELAAVTVFKDELLNTQNFDISILHFENAILLLPMTSKKLQRFYNFIDGLKVMNAL